VRGWAVKIGVPVAALAMIVGLSMAGPAMRNLTQGVDNLAICGALGLGAFLPDGTKFNSQQVANASIIVATAQQAGVGQTGAVIAVTAAFTESRLINVAGGDRDSLGLFQERPSQGWGTPQEIMNPVYATHQFLSHLIAIPGWRSLPPAEAAQAVERSAYPDRYQAWVQPAMQLVAGLSGTGACTNGDGLAPVAGAVPGVGGALPIGFNLPATTPAPVVTALGFVVAQLGKPYVWGGIGPNGYDCSGLIMQAYRLVGIGLPRTTYEQVYAGQPIYDPAQIAPGDLLFTLGSDPGPGGLPGHEGIAIGSGLVIDAPHTGATVQVTSLSSWVGQIVAIRRIVPG
jgi:hypothetical protein